MNKLDMDVWGDLLGELKIVGTRESLDVGALYRMNFAGDEFLFQAKRRHRAGTWKSWKPLAT